MITVEDFMYLCIENSECKVTLYDVNKEKDVWTGRGDEIPDKYMYRDVLSWDVPEKAGAITLNI